MDAKPHRPLRGVPSFAFGTENIVPIKQSLHQRHKSMGTLKPMASSGGLNAGAKRTAFVDLSNTSRALVDLGPKGQVKERVAIFAGNREGSIPDKENVPVAGNEAFRRPALRHTGYTSKSTIPVPSTSSTTVASTKPSIYSHTDTHSSTSSWGESQVPPPAKAAGSKKAPYIFEDQKDIKPSVKVEAPVPKYNFEAPAAKHNFEAPAAKYNFAPMETQPAKNPRHYRSQPQLRVEQPVVLRRTQSRYLGKSDELDNYDDSATEASYVDALEVLPEVVAQVPQTDEARLVPDDTTPEAEGDLVARGAACSTALPVPPPISEGDEYWDEDDEGEEFYDEQGYTTAHSYRSHGDNTTGGPTTLMAPKITARIREDLAIAKMIVEDSRTEDEIEEETWDISMAAEYAEEIFEHMRNLEARMLPNPHYMDIQTEIKWSMRSILMEWLIQVHQRFGLLPETLFLAVNYIDRFLSVKVVSLGKLQLVGATAIFLAAKYEEINCPSIQEIEYMVNRGYEGEEILKAERFMLSMLQFDLGWPGPMSFLRRISKADDYDLETRTLAKYFLEATILDERFVGCPASFLAAGAHCLARLMLRKGDWSMAHMHYSGYTMCQLEQLVATIFECCLTPRKHHAAVFNKYANAKYKRASTYVEVEISNGFVLPFSSNPTHSMRFPDPKSGLANYEAYTTGFPLPSEEDD